MLILSRRAVAAYLVAVSSLSALSIALDRSIKTPTGLTVATESQLSSGQRSRFDRQTEPGARLSTHLSLDQLLAEEPALSGGPFRVRWAGVWHVPEQGSFDFFVAANDRVGLTIDGRQVAAADSGQIRTVELDAGFHDLQIDYRQIRGDSALYAQWSPTGELPRRFDGDSLFPHEPSSAAFATNRWLRLLRRLTLSAWVLPAMVLIGVAAIRSISHLHRRSTPNPRGQVLLGGGVVILAFIGYFNTLGLLESHVSGQDDLVFSADTASAIHAIVWGPSMPRATNHPLFLLVRPLVKLTQTTSPVTLTRGDAIRVVLALIAALNCLAMYLILLGLLFSAAMAAWFSGLYAVFLSNLVLFGVPEVYSLATFTVLIYLFFALRKRETRDSQ